jgi:hydrogenase-4 component F
VAAVLVILVTVAFFGMSWYTTQTMLSPDPTAAAVESGPESAVAKGEVSAWIVVAMAIGIVALVVLGVHPPSQLSHLLSRAAAELGSAR